MNFAGFLMGFGRNFKIIDIVSVRSCFDSCLLANQRKFQKLWPGGVRAARFNKLTENEVLLGLYTHSAR